MRSKLPKFKWNRHTLIGAGGFVLVFAVGWFLLHFLNYRAGKILQNASYDWGFEFSLLPITQPAEAEVVLVYLDDMSHTEMNQPFDRPWDRGLHAKLVDRMTHDGARAVVFDIVFAGPGPSPEADQAFEDAIRRNKRVVLASDLIDVPVQSLGGAIPMQAKVELPYEPFRNAAAGYGFNQVPPDEDFVSRRHLHGFRDFEDDDSLTWATAKVIGLKMTRDPRERAKERWVKYYGPPYSIPNLSYRRVDSQPPGFFRNKVVIIGARPNTGLTGERRDEFRSPYGSWYELPRFMPGAEIHATLLMNLMADDALRRLAPFWEWTVLYFMAAVFGIGLYFLQPSRAVLAAAGGAGLVALVAMTSFSLTRYWFPWLIVVGAQIPVALTWVIAWKSLLWYWDRRRLELDRRRAENRIRNQAALLDMARDAIIVQKLLGRITYWNKSAERLYGWSAYELVDQNTESPLLKKEDPKISEAHRALAEKGEWNGELRQRTKAGKEIIVESRWTLVRDEDQKASSILMINTDVTERRKLEAQFLRNQRMESIGTLAGGIAHDLNNVLAPIVMGVEIMSMKERNPDSLRMLKMLGGSAKRGADMVKQVLSFARGQDGEKSLLQITHLIKEMDKIVQETFPKSVVCKTEIMEALMPVMGDATQVHQVLLNLCVNARDAMPEGGTLTIRARNTKLEDPLPTMIIPAKPGNYVELSVSDSGTGIPPEVIDRIFEPFFTTKEVGKGTGLGLSTVVSIIKGHGAVLDLKTTVGKGTTFVVYFPHAENTAPAREDAVLPEHLMGHGEVVLVVDDEDSVREITTATLDSQGYEVLPARNGLQAVKIFQENADRISVVVMDMMMPVMNGATAIREIRKIRPDVKIIANSGLLELEKVRQETGVPDLAFLAKPYGAEALLLAVRTAVQERRRPVTAAVREPSLTL